MFFKFRIFPGIFVSSPCPFGKVEHDVQQPSRARDLCGPARLHCRGVSGWRLGPVGPHIVCAGKLLLQLPPPFFFGVGSRGKAAEAFADVCPLGTSLGLFTSCVKGHSHSTRLEATSGMSPSGGRFAMTNPRPPISCAAGSVGAATPAARAG